MMAEKTVARGFKGFVFSLDAILAVSVMIIFIVASFILIAKSSVDPYANLQTVRLERDLLAVMEKSGAFDRLDGGEIEDAIEYSLPHGSEFYFSMETYMYANGTFVMASFDRRGQQPPGSVSVYGARRDIVTKRGAEMEYTVARLWIW